MNFFLSDEPTCPNCLGEIRIFQCYFFRNQQRLDSINKKYDLIKTLRNTGIFPEKLNIKVALELIFNFMFWSNTENFKMSK